MKYLWVSQDRLYTSEYGRTAACTKTHPSRRHNPALIPTLAVCLSDGCNLCLRLLEAGAGGVIDVLAPHHAGGVSMLCAPASQVKSNHWFCSSDEDLAVVSPSAPTVSQSERSSRLQAVITYIHHPASFPSPAAHCYYPLMNQRVRGKYSWRAIKITKRDINHKHRSWQDYWLNEYLSQRLQHQRVSSLLKRRQTTQTPGKIILVFAHHEFVKW